MAAELMIWDDSLLVGNELIDSQHKELVKAVNTFYVGIDMGGIVAKVSFSNTVQGLQDYAKKHFADEEELMRKASYLFLPEHKKVHESFIEEVARQVKKMEEDKNPDPTGFARFLRDWVLQHIAGHDRKYAPYLAKAGLS